MRVCVISGVIKDSKVLQALSASFAQACEFHVCNAKWFTPVPALPGLGPALSRLPRATSMGLCWCDSGTGSLLCYGFGTGIWQAYESTPLAVIAVNRHQSSISSLESLSTSKYPQLIVRPRTAQWAIRSRVRRGGARRPPSYDPPPLCAG